MYVCFMYVRYVVVAPLSDLSLSLSLNYTYTYKFFF